MPENLKVGVMASGRGSNFRSLAVSCAGEDYPADISLLVTDNPGAGALQIAEDMKIESAVVDCGSRKGSMTPHSSERICSLFEERGVGLVCLAGFMRIVKGRLMEQYSLRMINIHPALLPSFKGLHGQRQALEYGVRYSGCTVHFVDEGIDTGPIIIQKVVPVLQDDTEDTLSERILEQEHRAYPEAVRLFAEDRLDIIGRRVFIS
ncbi:MAG: phosphoribosylglycinamide formyltransferase [Candidatus Krumholzibacteriales bacterium]